MGVEDAEDRPDRCATAGTVVVHADWAAHGVGDDGQVPAPPP
jgi:hypothetical protein